MSDRPCCILLDNGSLKPAATLGLRSLAAALSDRADFAIHPVSLLHSAKIPAEELGGEPAPVLEQFLDQQRQDGVDSFLIVPLFFGHSAAVYEYLPQQLQQKRQAWPALELRLAPPLVDIGASHDTAVAEILAANVRDIIEARGLTKPFVTVVDHGSPRLAVTRARNMVAEQLSNLLGDSVNQVRASSMERREGEQYDFNAPLLETLLGDESFSHEVVAALMFSLPGRHAGSGGDIEQICRESETQKPGQKIFATELFGNHPRAIDLLLARLKQGLASETVVEEIPPPGF
jgi:sirohydrochlorin ferrochelatase